MKGQPIPSYNLKATNDISRATFISLHEVKLSVTQTLSAKLRDTGQKCRNTHLELEHTYFLCWFNTVLEPVLKSTNIVRTVCNIRLISIAHAEMT